MNERRILIEGRGRFFLVQSVAQNFCLNETRFSALGMRTFLWLIIGKYQLVDIFSLQSFKLIRKIVMRNKHQKVNQTYQERLQEIISVCKMSSS